MKDEANRFAVVYTKRPGIVIVFNTCPTEDAAAKLVTGLAAIGCKARVVPALADDTPGVQRRRCAAGG